MGFLNLKKIPKKWNMFMLVVGASCAVLIAGYSFLMKKTTTPVVVSIQKSQKIDSGIGGVGGEGTPQYNEMLREDNQDRANQASEKGKSYISAPVGTSKDSLLEEAAPQSSNTTDTKNAVPSASSPSQTATRATRTDTTKEITRLVAYIENVRQAGRPQGTPVNYAFSLPPAAKAETKQSQSAPVMPGIEALIPGTILYATNDLTVNSDVAGTPVLATVIHGPLKGARVMGKFELRGERLVVSFQSITRDSVTMPFNGYGVDPEKAEAGVASHVNNHTFLRWGAFIAASFLEGMGTALQDSGSTRLYNAYETVTFKDKYDAGEQVQIAAGKVGERAASQLEKHLDTPPTVSLYAGTSIGILIIK